MAYNFDKVTLLTYDHTPTFFDAGIRYRVLKQFTIEGIFTNLTGTIGVSGTTEKYQDFLKNADDYQDIVLNGIAFGRGKVTSLANTEGSHVRLQPHTVSIECFETGNLFNVQSQYYSGIDYTNYDLIDTFSENFSYNLNEDGTQTYTHNLSIRLNSGENVNPIQDAKNIASNLLANANLTGFIADWESGKAKRKFYTETYNEINSTVSIDETVNILPNDSGIYSHNFTHSLSTDENGITTATEAGQIQGGIEFIELAALSGWYEQEPLIYSRVNDTYTQYVVGTLNARPITAGKTQNEREGLIDYTYTFSDNPNFQNLYSHIYNISLSKDIQNVSIVTEQGMVEGFGRILDNKYTNAISGYENDVKPSILPRISGYYIENTDPNYNLYLTSQNEERDQINGIISYGFDYTDNSTYVNESGIKVSTIDVQTAYPVHLIGKFNVPNVKELVQESNQSTVGTRNVNINLLGARNLELHEYIEYAKGIIKLNGYNNITGGNSEGYMQNVNYSWTPNTNNFTFDILFNFHGFYKTFSNLKMT